MEYDVWVCYEMVIWMVELNWFYVVVVFFFLFGISEYYMCYLGMLLVSLGVFLLFFEDVICLLVEVGFDNLFVFNGYGGNVVFILGIWL